MIRSLLFLTVILSCSLRAAEPVRPNIVFAFADDWGRYASAYRDPARPSPNDIVETPVFDRLAREGVLFLDAHASAPSCTPSRTAVLTGRHFYRNGSGAQLHSPWMPGFADPVLTLSSYHNLLEAAGWHTGVTWKRHVAEHLFGDKSHHYDKAGKDFNSFSQQMTAAPDKVARKAELLGEVRGNFRDFLAAGKPGQPFCWYVSPTNTHRAWTRGSGKALWGLNPDDLKGKLPAFLPDNEVMREDFADYLGECMAFDAAVGVIVDELEARGQLANTVLAVSGDHGVPGFPRGKTNLYTIGTQVPLVIHWPAGITAPGRRIAPPVSLIDLAPTFLAAAGLPPHPDMDGRNLLPVLQATGAETPGLAESSVITGRELHFGNARADNLPYPSRAIRTERWLYIRNFKPERWPMGDPLAVTDGTAPPFARIAQNTGLGFGDLDASPAKAWLVEHRNESAVKPYTDYAWGKRPAEELYDLQADPDEVKNLAADPAFAATRQEFADRLMTTLRQTGDPRVTGEGDAFDRAPWRKPPPQKKGQDAP